MHPLDVYIKVYFFRFVHAQNLDCDIHYMIVVLYTNNKQIHVLWYINIQIMFVVTSGS